MSQEWGPRLAAWLEDHLKRRGLTVYTWCDSTPGVNGSDVTRWSHGTEPTIAKFRAVATGLGVSLTETLLAAGVMTEDEASAPTTPSLDEAIEHDPTLTDWERPRIRDFVDALRAVSNGEKTRITRKTR